LNIAGLPLLPDLAGTELQLLPDLAGTVLWRFEFLVGQTQCFFAAAERLLGCRSVAGFVCGTLAVEAAAAAAAAAGRSEFGH